MDSQNIIIVDTPKPLQAHVLWLSSKAPFATGHKVLVTDIDSGKSMTTRSMKLHNDYNVCIYNRKREFVDSFAVTYAHFFNNENMLIKR